MSKTEGNGGDWYAVPWPQAERQVYKLQRRIYRASQRGDLRAVHRLQKRLLKSWFARCLAVRRVTQDNKGKKTPGVDGVADLSPEQRLELVDLLDIDTKPRPARRVWIPKPGTDEKRGLGIPTMSDRALQALALLALEPEWEARFEANSYGFRPGRSCHDAIEAIFNSICKQNKYVLDADIAKCFDRIDHEALLKKLNTFSGLRRLIRRWLKAGVLDQGALFPTEEGTPQGGVLSPLLANVALHRMEADLQAHFKGRVKSPPTLVRYADDFVVLHKDLWVVQESQAFLTDWLKPLGLELKASKTHISHTLTSHSGRVGFDFLGFTVRQFHTGKKDARKKRPFKTVIKPSKAKVKLHLKRLRDLIHQFRAVGQTGLMAVLEPTIRGWCNYYRPVCGKEAFSRCDTLLFRMLWRWARRRHPMKPTSWVRNRYWHRDGKRVWVFRVVEEWPLFQHSWTPIVRHIKVEGNRSPYDGDWEYWSARLGRYPGVSPWLAKVLKEQKGRCARCGNYLAGRTWDAVDLHHVNKDRTDNRPTNIQVLHRHCHQLLHREERSRVEVVMAGSADDSG